MNQPLQATDFNWHWERPDFDDLAIQQAVEQHVALGRAAWPKWNYPIPGPYNGHTGIERVEGWKRVWLAVRMGRLPAPTVCSICKVRSGTVQYHNEDYARPLQCKPVCQSCHKIIHLRFRSPDSWLQLVARCHIPGKVQWFETIKMAERNIIGEQHIVTVRVTPQGKGIQRKSPQTMRVAVRHRSRKTD